jgi:hypothetical protein
MPMQEEVTTNVTPKSYTNGLDTTVTSVKIRGYSQFDPHDGVTAMVVLFNSANKIVSTTQVRITGADYQNWPVNQTKEEDTAYATTIILNKLGFTVSA